MSKISFEFTAAVKEGTCMQSTSEGAKCLNKIKRGRDNHEYKYALMSCIICIQSIVTKVF